MKFRVGLPLVLCLALAASRASEPLVSIGPNVPVFLSMDGTVRYDDNIYLQKENKTGDTIWLLMPGVDLHTAGGVGKADLAYTEQFVRYSSHSSLNSNLASVVGSAGYDSGPAQISANASYQEMDQSNLRLRSYDETVRRNLTDASISGNVGLAGKTALGTGIHYDKTAYPKVGFSDTTDWSVPVDLYYSVTPKSDLSLGYRYTRTTTENNLSNSKDNFFNIGARGQFTPKLSGQIRTGYTELRQDKGGSNHSLGLDANLSYALTPKSSLALQASNNYTNAASGDSERVFSFGLDGEFAVSQQWNVTTGVSYEGSHYLSAFGRRDRFWSANVGVVYVVSLNSSAQLSYVFRKDSSNVNVDFQGSVVSLSYSIRF